MRVSLPAFPLLLFLGLGIAQFFLVYDALSLKMLIVFCALGFFRVLSLLAAFTRGKIFYE